MCNMTWHETQVAVMHSAVGNVSDRVACDLVSRGCCSRTHLRFSPLAAKRCTALHYAVATVRRKILFLGSGNLREGEEWSKFQRCSRRKKKSGVALFMENRMRGEMIDGEVVISRNTATKEKRKRKKTNS